MSREFNQATASEIILGEVIILYVTEVSPDSCQSTIKCCTDCCTLAPRLHSGLSLNLHLYISSLHHPCPVRIHYLVELNPGSSGEV